MTTFEEKKKEFEKRVKDNYFVYKMILQNNKNNPNTEVLIDPQTELEVLLADNFLTFFIDFYGLTSMSLNNELKDENPEDNYVYNAFLNMIRARKNNDEQEVKNIESYIYEKAAPKECAKYMFDLFSYVQNRKLYVRMLYEELGFDKNSEESYNEFLGLFEQSLELLDIIFYNDVNLRKLDSSEDMFKVARVAAIFIEFHKLADDAFNKAIKLSKEKK